MPQFWPDSGRLNDAVVSLCIMSSFALWIWLGWRLELPWLLGAALILGPLGGLLVGVSLVAFLSTYCRKNK